MMPMTLLQYDEIVRARQQIAGGVLVTPCPFSPALRVKRQAQDHILVPFERAEQLHSGRQGRRNGLAAWPDVSLGWFLFRHGRTISSRTQTISHAVAARNAPDLLGGCLRSPLPGAATGPTRMPPACPVEIHARCSERSAIPATNVTIHRASRWHSLLRSGSAARWSRQDTARALKDPPSDLPANCSQE